MKQNEIFGILFVIVVIFGLVLFIFDIKNGLLKFGKLTGGSKALSLGLLLVSIVAMGAGGYFAYQNFTWTAPPENQIAKDLKDSIKSAKENNKEYKQKISLEKYLDADLSELENSWSDKGKAELETVSQGSSKTKELILRTVGRKISAGENTTSLLAISGERVNLLDGKNRMLVFLDTSEYSVKQLKLLKSYSNKENPVEVVLIFPTATGSDVKKMFEDNSGSIGSIDDSIIVDNDSMSPNSNSSLKFLATGEYKVSVMPSYVLIDKNSVVSLAGTGSIFNSVDELSNFYSKAFTEKDKLYQSINATDSNSKTDNESNNGGK